MNDLCFHHVCIKAIKTLVCTCYFCLICFSLISLVIELNGIEKMIESLFIMIDESHSDFSIEARIKEFYTKITEEPIYRCFFDLTEIQTKYPDFYREYPDLLSFLDVGKKLENNEYANANQFIDDLERTSSAFTNYFPSDGGMMNEAFHLHTIGVTVDKKLKKMRKLLNMNDNEYYLYKFQKLRNELHTHILERPTDFHSQQIWEQIQSFNLKENIKKIEPPPLESVFKAS